MNDDRPVLYSFRRCPYAMRTRMTLLVSGLQCELREVVLRNKPPEMLAASPKGTVPVMVHSDGTVMDESLQIMWWALSRNDPDRWLEPDSSEAPSAITDLIDLIDGRFKEHLDRYKYSTRYQHENAGTGVNPIAHRQSALEILHDITYRLQQHSYLFGKRPGAADIAIAPFVRQFANTDPDWFAANANPLLREWLQRILQSSLFERSMKKYPVWQSGEPGTLFPSDEMLEDPKSINPGNR